MRVRVTKSPVRREKEIVEETTRISTDLNGIIFVDESTAMARAREIGLPKGPLSYTQISTFLMCPKDYDFKYVQRIRPEGWSENLILGHAIHAGFEILASAKMHGAKVTSALLADAQSVCSTDVNRQIDTTAGITPADKKRLRVQTDLCNQILEAWFEAYLPNITPVGVEEKLFVLVAGVPLIIIIDLDDNGTIKDYKLTRRTKSKQDAENSLQLTLYSAIKNATQAGFISCPFPDLAKTKFDPLPKEIVVPKTPGDKKWALEILGSLAKTIVVATREKQFNLCDPTSWKCSEKFCDSWAICRGKVVGAKQIPDFLNLKK